MNESVDLDRFTSRRSTVYAANGIVATSQPLAAEAGTTTLRRGGNAFDAAVATAASLNVVEPTNTGLGGDVFALYRTADGDIGGMQSCGGAPGNATVDRVRRLIAEKRNIPPERVEMPFRGPHTVTVPGTARGWEATIERFGRLSLSDVLAPAIEQARTGFPVSEIIAHDWRIAEELFDDEHAREAYLNDGQAPTVGEVVQFQSLGETLQRIADCGADVVYEGEVGQAIADEVQAKGGLLTTSDLADFEPSFVDPVQTKYRGVDVFELPPNNQGLIALEALNIAEELGAGDHPRGSVDRIHYLVEALKLAFHDGHEYITDPEYESIPPLGSKEYAARRAEAAGPEANTNIELGTPRGEAGDTVLLTVADAEGNLVSYINSRFAGFGSGLVAGDTGIALQNRGSSFSLDPDHPNSLDPNKRPFHTLIPGLAKFGPDDWAAFGVMGGYMQPQGHLQLLVNLIDDGQPLQAALDAPRWRYRESGELAVEAQMNSNVLPKLSRRGHDIRVEPPVEFGGAQLVRNEDGVLSGATDPRKDGTVVGF
jgi:gamma-glutamyltranspeptidase/glutathione hydrolase